MRHVLVLAALVAVSLAGCADEPDANPGGDLTLQACRELDLVLGVDEQGAPACVEPPFVIEDFEEPNHHCVVTAQRDRVHAPDLVGDPWILGQSWSYALEVDGESLGTTQLVYYDDQDFFGNDKPSHYMVGTPTREEALRHAMFSENPVIGRIHAILYSPHESGDHADMFHFPLCEGSSWSTTFYGESFTLTARDADLPLPGASNTSPGFIIAGSADSGSTLELTYSPVAKWFTYIHLARSDGSSVNLDLQSMDTGYEGEAFFLRGQKDATATLAAVSAGPAAALASQVEIAREDGSTGPYDTVGFHITGGIEAGTGYGDLNIRNPNGDVVWSHEVNAEDGRGLVDELLEFPYEAGDWIMNFSGFAANSEGSAEFAFKAQVVSIYDRSCTVGGNCGA